MTPSDPPPRNNSESSGVARIPTSSPPAVDIDLESEDILFDEPLTLGEPAIAKNHADADDVEITTGESEVLLEDLDLDEGDDPCPSPFERITVAPQVPEREYVARMMREAPASEPVPSQPPVTRPPETVANRAAAEQLAREDAEAAPESDERVSTKSGSALSYGESELSQISSWPAPSSGAPLTLDLVELVESVPPPQASVAPDAPVSIPPPPSLPDEVSTGIRERAAMGQKAPSDAPIKERPSSGPTQDEAAFQNNGSSVEPPAGAENRPPLSFGPMSGDALELVGVRAQSVKPPASIGITMRAVRDRFDVGDFSGALILAEGILEHDPESVDALLYAEHCRDVLKQMYISRLGGVGRVPQVAVSDEQLRWLSLDHRAGFLLSLVDGHSSFEEVLDMSGMPSVDALRLLLELLQQNVIKVA